MNFADFKVLTFDCYGTLIDWENGILRSLRPFVNAHNIVIDDDALLALYGTCEAEAEHAAFRKYRDILCETMLGIAQRIGITPTEAETNALLEGFSEWLPFPDTVEALQKLASRYRLVVVSNVDDDLFALSAQRLGVGFADVITAQQVGSYKPNLRNFETALHRVGVPKQQVLHVAQSLYHDIAPAKILGLSTVWVNRRAGKPGTGATPLASAQPDLEVTSLAALVDHIETAQT